MGGLNVYSGLVHVDVFFGSEDVSFLISVPLETDAVLISAILPMLSPGPDFALLRIVAKSLILPLGLPRFLDS